MILQLPQRLYRRHLIVRRGPLGVPRQLRRRRRPRVGLQRGERRGVCGSARGRRARRLECRVWVWRVSSLPCSGDGGWGAGPGPGLHFGDNGAYRQRVCLQLWSLRSRSGWVEGHFVRAGSVESVVSVRGEVRQECRQLAFCARRLCGTGFRRRLMLELGRGAYLYVLEGAGRSCSAPPLAVRHAPTRQRYGVPPQTALHRHHPS